MIPQYIEPRRTPERLREIERKARNSTVLKVAAIAWVIAGIVISLSGNYGA